MALLDAALADQVRAYLQHVREPVELVCSLDGDSDGDGGTGPDDAGARMRSLLEEVAALSPKVTARFDGDDARRPSFQVTRAGEDLGMRFAAVPLGHELSSFVLAVLQAGGHPPKIPDDVADRIRSLGEGGEEYVFETYMSLTCHNCPDVVQALNTMAALNPRVRHTAVDGALFRAEVDERQVMAVPMVWLNGRPFLSGRTDLTEILAKVDTATSARDAARLATKDVFDVLVVGGGPAGATAALYAARKGISTGVVAQRFGGQTLDTLGIENYPSVLHVEGPKLAAAFEAHARAYDVDLMTGQVAVGLTPPSRPGEPVVVTLENGAMLHGRTVVLAPGARWRTLGVPGEDEYRTRGVAFCPSCDGPLYKGKRVAVVGGGNSGVEAAIDLAGVVEHVTLLEFTDRLNADRVLIDRLTGLRNATVVTSAQTTEVVGDGTRVTGLRWVDRTAGAEHVLDVAGVFVQIGLVPGTEWLEGTVALSRTGEIVVDARCATSVPGVFAAGDATTTPYKQIVVAAGEGAKAALSAFDHLIRGGTARPADTDVDLREAEPASRA